MQLNQTSTLLIALFSIIVCYSMDDTCKVLSESDLLPVRYVRCFEINALAKTPQNGQDLSTYFDVKIVEKDLADFLQPMKPQQTFKIAPEFIQEWIDIRKILRSKILNTYTELETKYERLEPDNRQGEIELLTSHLNGLQAELQNNEAEHNALSEELITIQRRNSESQKIIAQLETKVIKEKKELDKFQLQKKRKKISDIQVSLPNNQQSSFQNTTPSFNIRNLFRRYKVKKQSEFIEKLSEISYNLHHFPNENIINNDKSYWIEQDHILVTKVKQNNQIYTLIFSPCTEVFGVSNQTYSPEDSSEIVCKKPCRNEKIALIELMKTISAIDDNMLSLKLKHIANYLWKNPKAQPIIPSYFDKTNHILIGKINPNWIYIFCPCNGKIGGITPQSYPCSLAKLQKNNLLPIDFLCKKQCKNYPSSHSQSDSRFDSNSCSSSHSDGDSDEYITKDKIERI